MRAAGLAPAASVAVAAPALARWAREALPGSDPRASGAVARRIDPTNAAAVVSAPITSATFPVRGDTLHVAFDVPEPAGALEFVAPAADAHASLPGEAAGQVRVDVQGGVVRARLLVLPAGVRVRNDPPGRTRYRVTVPAHVHMVRVLVGTHAVAVVDPAQLAAGVRVPLAPWRGRRGGPGAYRAGLHARAPVHPPEHHPCSGASRV
jgi:hypothetical protein